MSNKKFKTKINYRFLCFLVLWHSFDDPFDVIWNADVYIGMVTAARASRAKAGDAYPKPMRTQKETERKEKFRWNRMECFSNHPTHQPKPMDHFCVIDNSAVHLYKTKMDNWTISIESKTMPFANESTEFQLKRLTWVTCGHILIFGWAGSNQHMITDWFIPTSEKKKNEIKRTFKRVLKMYLTYKCQLCFFLNLHLHLHLHSLDPLRLNHEITTYLPMHVPPLPVNVPPHKCPSCILTCSP